MCDAVAYAHSKQIIHRDLKPENIMLGEFGEVLVMDWGLAKILTESRAGILPASDGSADGSGNGYLRTVCDYVHLNPVRAKLIKGGQPLESFGWSSYGEYLNTTAARPPWLRVDRLLGAKGIPRDTAAGRKELARQMEERRREAADENYGSIRRGWCLGDEAFRLELVSAAKDRAGESHYSADRRAAGEAKARRMVKAGLKGLGCEEAELRARAKSDPDKVKLGKRLRAETTMGIKWIAQRLALGSWTYASNLLSATGKR